MKFIDPNALEQVREFHNLFRCPVVAAPAIPAPDRCALRVNLLEEEVQELADAIRLRDLVEIADALADIQYVLGGAVLEFGMGGCFCALFDEVQRSNMSKACVSEEEARRTQEHYRENKGDTRSYVEKFSDAQWFVYREGDHKALKSVNYSPASLEPILAAAATDDEGRRFAMPDALTGVAAFHRLIRGPVLEAPAIPPAERCALRVSLLEEEVQELADAIRQKDLVEIADALADIQYVLSGAVLEFGCGRRFGDLFEEVHRSNMSKACRTSEEAEKTRQHYKELKGTASFAEKVAEGKWLVYREGDRKALKSVNYSPANLKEIIV